jgi:hypothetical protein
LLTTDENQAKGLGGNRWMLGQQIGASSGVIASTSIPMAPDMPSYPYFMPSILDCRWSVPRALAPVRD